MEEYFFLQSQVVVTESREKFLKDCFRLIYRRAGDTISSAEYEDKVINKRTDSKTTANACAYCYKLLLKD